MTRFFAEPSNLSDGKIRLNEEDISHIRALRLRPGESFTVCTGVGTDYICRLSDDGGGVAEIVGILPSTGEPAVKCTVFAAIAKGERLEFAVQKSVELGAHNIVLFLSERCISTPSGKSLAKKIARLQKIALEAAKQCGRGRVPEVTAADSFAAAVTVASGFDLPLFFYELEQSFSLKQALDSRGAAVKTVAVFTGPEGGFTELEAQYAANAGMLTVSLGPRILRCETAPMCALSALMFFTGNL